MDKQAAEFIFNIVRPYFGNFKTDAVSSSNKCWLCGGVTKNGLPLRKGISKTFCLPEQAKSPNSGIVCLPCHAMSSKKYFDAYAAARPEMGLKPGYATSWRNYSHVAFKGHHSCPSRAKWVEWLLDPPKPPFIFVMAVSSQKHLIYKSKISVSRELFFVQMEDSSVTVEREPFKKCFAAIQGLLNLGFFKKHILENKYPYKFIMSCKEEWKNANDELNFFRKFQPLWLDLGCFCAINPPKDKK